MSLEPSCPHLGGSRCLALRARREPPSLRSLGVSVTPSPSTMGPVAIRFRRMLALWTRRSRPLLSGNGRHGPSRRGGKGKRKDVREEKKKEKKNRAKCRKRRKCSSCSRSSSCCYRRSRHSYRGENSSRSSWSSAGSKTCRSFNDSSSSGVNSWKSCSNSHREARAIQNRCRRKGPRPGKRDYRSMVLQPPRGSVQEGLPPSQPSLGGKMVWWRSLVPCAHQQIPSLRSRA